MGRKRRRRSRPDISLPSGPAGIMPPGGARPEVSAPGRMPYAAGMRRATAIILVLMGGGLVILSPFLAQPSKACADARAAQRPDADEICDTSHGGSHGSWSGGSGGRASASDATHASAGAASVERGGFGATGFHFFSFGG